MTRQESENIHNWGESFHLSEDFFHEIVEIAKVGIASHKPDGTIIYVNQSMADMMGYPREEIIGRSSLDFLDEQEKKSVINTQKSLRHHNDVTKERQIKRKDGSILWTRVNIIPQFEAGVQVGYLAMHTDITEQKHAEEALSKSQESYKEIVENSGSIIMKADKNLNITFMNDFGLKFFGYSIEELRGQNVVGTTIPKRDNAGRDLEAMAMEIRDKPQSFSTNVHQNIRKNGELVWISWTNMPKYDEDGNLIEILAIGNDISKLIKAEEALQESQERFFKAFYKSPVPMTITLVEECRWVVVNDAYVHLLGYSREELEGHSSREFNLIDPAERERLLKILREEGSLKGEEISLRIKDGNKLIVLCFSETIALNGQKHEVVTVIDITDRKRMEDALFESEKRFKTVLDNSRDVIYRFDLQKNKFDYISPSCNKITGYSCEELIGLDQNEFLSIIHPEDRTAFSMTLKQLEETGEIEIVYRQKTRDGIYRWISNNLSLVHGIDGQPQYHYGSLRDISSIKLIEEALLESRSKLDLALENACIGLWEWNVLTNEVLWDDRTEKMFGLKPGSFEKRFEAFEKLIHEEDIQHVRKTMRTSFQKNVSAETIFRTRPVNGKIRYLSSKAHVNQDADGNTIGFTGVIFDITDLKEGTERLIMKLNEDLLRSNKELESFAYITSHDLQEPLRMVTSYAQLLAQRYEGRIDRNANEFIGYIVEGAKRMYDLINDLLNYSRIGKKEVTFSDVDTNKVIDTVISNISKVVKERNCKIEYGNLPVVFADHTQMIQLFQNLISNAIKFSREDPQVIISARKERTQFVFSVKDNGIGIEPEYFNRIFEIFKRLNPRDEFEGTGIGLAICKKIIENLNGKIWVESVPGKGTTFYFTIQKKRGNTKKSSE